MSKCPKCNENLDSPDTIRLKSIMRSMSLVNILTDYILNDIPKRLWHSDVIEFAHNNLIIDKTKIQWEC